MKKRRWIKFPVFLACLVPAGYLAWRAWHQDLTANPIEYITHFTGDWAIRLIVTTLAVTPLHKTWPRANLIAFRRMIGLFAFFYATLHFSTWLGVDKFFDLQEIGRDFVKRRFIIVGLTAFLLMVPLAVTSTTGWIRRLGKRWRRLHRLIYATAVLAVIHYYWLVKSDVRLPLLYGSLVAVLLGYRVVAWLRGRRARARRSPDFQPAQV